MLVAQEVVPALGHNEYVYSGYNPTCTSIGYTDGWRCERCRTVTVERVVIPATGHKFIYYHSDNNATCEKDGTKTARCENYNYYSRCSERDTVTDTGSKLTHKDDNHDGWCDNRYCKYDFTDNCSHMCHKNNGKGTGWYRFYLFFWKLFKMNKTCSCGKYHYY